MAHRAGHMDGFLHLMIEMIIRSEKQSILVSPPVLILDLGLLCTLILSRGGILRDAQKHSWPCLGNNWLESVCSWSRFTKMIYF